MGSEMCIRDSHERDDGRVVKMVGIAHTTTPHEIIYDTVQESLD